ncbi:hypothetical protein NH14_005110 [Paraburkholderia sacchari]|uniref:Glucose-methanol-choline oxidoreductase C-terminal domain-containing protein n=1 Tax=Paraburkholderia sacchari TaxID=159450 RepID=A0A8T6Z701_9BURK|nr:hypothetical protein [Paraburkholderia sacchari]
MGRRDAIAAVKAIRNVVGQEAWDSLRGEEVTPGASIKTDEQILAYLRDTAGTNYHPSCTCRMGNGDDAVVNAEGGLHLLGLITSTAAHCLARHPTASL